VLTRPPLRMLRRRQAWAPVFGLALVAALGMGLATRD
jgi:hypothetical protein